jgi:hypothetical protein
MVVAPLLVILSAAAYGLWLGLPDARGGAGIAGALAAAAVMGILAAKFLGTPAIVVGGLVGLILG